jgi:hypothetical protein
VSQRVCEVRIKEIAFAALRMLLDRYLAITLSQGVRRFRTRKIVFTPC